MEIKEGENLEGLIYTNKKNWFENSVILAQKQKGLLSEEETLKSTRKFYSNLAEIFQLEGYDVYILNSKNNSFYCKTNLISYNELNLNGVGIKPIDVSVKTNRDLISVLWPKTMFQVFEDEIYVSYDNLENSKRVLYNIGKRKNVKISEILSDGSFNIKGKNLLIFPEGFILEENLRKLKYLGYNIEFLPHPNYKEKKILKNRRENYKNVELRRTERFYGNHNLDCYFNLVQTKEGEILMVLRQDYYENHKEKINELAEKLKGKLYIIERGSIDDINKSLNFLSFPNGKILVPNSSKGFKKFLKDGIGEENVYEIDVNVLFDYNGVGEGLRNMINFI